MILSYKKILNITLCTLGLFVFILGCEDKNKTTALHEEISVAGNVTILDIKENYETLNVQSPVLRATIIEFKDVTNYTYLLLEDKTGKVWAAIPKTPVKTGDEITISNIAIMKDFHSKTLEKTFDLILFAVLSEGCPFKQSGGEIVSEMPSSMMPGKMPPAMTSQAAMPHGTIPAMGGYGREEQCIHSDVDLLFLFEKNVPDKADNIIREIVYPLWDIGLEVGHSTRSLKECVNLSGEDFVIFNSVMDARFICGMSILYSELLKSSSIK